MSFLKGYVRLCKFFYSLEFIRLMEKISVERMFVEIFEDCIENHRVLIIIIVLIDKDG